MTSSGDSVADGGEQIYECVTATYCCGQEIESLLNKWEEGFDDQIGTFHSSSELVKKRMRS